MASSPHEPSSVRPPPSAEDDQPSAVCFSVDQGSKLIVFSSALSTMQLLPNFGNSRVIFQRDIHHPTKWTSVGPICVLKFSQ